ncbi:hypothetical protein [Planctomyces sp. SH-PL14]|uniref:hypothetical protein n=1 Tax=Planctomyces sp. SH-PL14 TaxID=1632864 RepID=UPI0009464674|nr:hypothetical protein [Planctomyces sp. SH-PL14]
MVGFEETDQEAVGVSAPDADDLAAVVDRFGEALDRNGPGFFFEEERFEGGFSLYRPGTGSGCSGRPEFRPIVRWAAFSGGFGAAELLGVVRFEEEDQELVGEPAFEADELPAVEDRFRDSLVPGDRPGLFFELERVLLRDGGEGLAVGFGDPEGVVVEFAGDAGLGGGDPDDAIGPVGFEEGLLFCRERFGHGVVPRRGRRSIGTGFLCPCKRAEKSARLSGSPTRGRGRTASRPRSIGAPGTGRGSSEHHDARA